jgi:hypothetical protein
MLTQQVKLSRISVARITAVGATSPLARLFANDRNPPDWARSVPGQATTALRSEEVRRRCSCARHRPLDSTWSRKGRGNASRPPAEPQSHSPTRRSKIPSDPVISESYQELGYDLADAARMGGGWAPARQLYPQLRNVRSTTRSAAWCQKQKWVAPVNDTATVAPNAPAARGKPAIVLLPVGWTRSTTRQPSSNGRQSRRRLMSVLQYPQA